jgi:hypothetical protein
MNTELVVAVATREHEMPMKLAAYRIYAALHEAAHVVAAAWYDEPIHNIAIIDTRGHFSYLNESTASFGSTRTLNQTGIGAAKVACAGDMFEGLSIRTENNVAYWQDYTDAVATLCSTSLSPFHGDHTKITHGKGFAGVMETHRELRHELLALLTSQWPLIEAVAVAILLYSDAKGVLNHQKTSELVRAIKHAPWRETGKQSPSLAALERRLGLDVTQYWNELVCTADNDHYQRKCARIDEQLRLNELGEKVDLADNIQRKPTMEDAR